MHSHRSLVLVPAFILAAACSKGDDRSTAASPLDRDLTLSAQLQGTAKQNGAVELAAGGGCTVQPSPRVPTAAQRAQAVALEQKAAEAEFAGNIAVARDLHRQAARLDGTSEAITYRLARAEEASADSAAAIAGYCRYLTLAPTAANAQEVRTRLNALLAGGAPTQVARAAAPASTPAPAARPTTVATTTTVRRAEGRRVATSEPVASQAVIVTPAAAPAESDVGAGSNENATIASSAGEVVTATAEPEAQAPMQQAPQVPQVRRPADHTARNAAIGAAAGAVIGGMAGRSAKSAVIGGVAGGLLGAVVGRTNQSGFRTPGFSH